MNNTSIFDQLVDEFASRGKHFEDFSRFSTPAFAWTAVNLRKGTAHLDTDETMSLPVVKPIAVMRLGQRGATA
jgi:hypothetical protein